MNTSPGSSLDTELLLETLDRLEAQILEYEQLFLAAAEQNDVVHQIFRTAHNLKSSLGMASKMLCSELVHAIESSFDHIRRGKRYASPQLFELSLAAIDAIRHSLASNSEPVQTLQNLAQKLTALAQESSPSIIWKSMPFVQALEVTLTDEEQALFDTAIELSSNIFQVEKLINPQRITREMYNSLPIFDDIRDIGVLIAMHPHFEDIAPDADEIILRILFATALSADEVSLHIFDPCKPVAASAQHIQQPRKMNSSQQAEQPRYNESKAATQGQYNMPKHAEKTTKANIPQLPESASVGFTAVIETLEALELYLIEYSSLLDEHRGDNSFVHHIFRYAHTLRGLLDMAHRQDLTKLIYAIESNFEFIRNGLTRPTKQLLEHCLQALDYIRRTIFNPPRNTDEEQHYQQDFDAIFQTLKHDAVRAEFKPRVRTVHVSQPSFSPSVESSQKASANPEQSTSQSTTTSKPSAAESSADTFPADTSDTSDTETTALPKLIVHSTESFLHLRSSPFSASQSAPQPAISPEKSVTAAETLSTIPRLRMLVADDDFISQTVLHEILRPLGHCWLASDGREALSLVQHDIELGKRFDLICLDIMMPFLSGIQVLEGIRNIEHSHNIYGLSSAKIIMTTALSDIHQVFYAFRKQCDAYLTKPITAAKVYYHLKKLNLITDEEEESQAVE
jgi:two-component system chemotaxis response regulator CheY